MKVVVKNAVNRFFSNTNFEMIYSESMANALDAQATQLDINIKIDSFENSSSLAIVIQDNGVGFTDQNFDRFSALLNTTDSNHKGLGRLVYLKYFSKVNVESVFAKDAKKIRRLFSFDSSFDGKKEDSETTLETKTFSRLSFSGFCNVQLNTYSNLMPKDIKQYLTTQFIPRLYVLKQASKQFKLNISLSTDKENKEKNFYSTSESFSLDELPLLSEKIIENQELDLFKSQFKLLYLAEQSYIESPNLVTALCIDDRTLDLHLL